MPYRESYSWVPPDELDEVTPKTALVDCEAEEFYAQRMAFFFTECVKLNSDIYIAEKILGFPLDSFSNHAEHTFWNRILDSLYEATLMRFTKLADDTHRDLYNLLPFKTWVYKHTNVEYQPALRKRLRDCCFEQTTDVIRTKARALRNSVVAHLKKDFVLGLDRVPVVSLTELKLLRNSVNRLLDALSFNVKHMLLPVQYATGVQHREGFVPDIDELLDLVALHSQILNEPETNPLLWSVRLESFAKERPQELAWITHYRQKFDMPTPWDNESSNTD